MTLLIININTDTIHIIARWNRKNLHYLHVTARPLMHGHAATWLLLGTTPSYQRQHFSRHLYGKLLHNGGLQGEYKERRLSWD